MNIKTMFLILILPRVMSLVSFLIQEKFIIFQDKRHFCSRAETGLPSNQGILWKSVNLISIWENQGEKNNFPSFRESQGSFELFYYFTAEGRHPVKCDSCKVLPFYVLCIPYEVRFCFCYDTNKLNAQNKAQGSPKPHIFPKQWWNSYWRLLEYHGKSGGNY